MADLSRLVHNIEKGKDLEFALSGYGNQMLNISNRLSGIRFVLNYTTFYDILYDGKAAADTQEELSPLIQAAIDRLNEAVRSHLQEENFSGEALEQQTAEIDALRRDVTGLMRCLTALSDRYTLFEYVMNRKEALFIPKQLPAAYSDETMTERLMSWLISDKDLMQLRLTQLIEQLPMRMTKSRFFQILENGLSVYTDGDRKSLEDELDMIRTSILLTEPSEIKQYFPEIYEQLRTLEQTDFEGMSAEDFPGIYEKMQQCGEILNNLIGIVGLLTELVNDLYVQILSAPYALAELNEKAAVSGILTDMLELFDGGIVSPVPEELYERFVALEGKQETLYDSFEEGVYALDGIIESRSDLLKSLMLEKIYCNLSYISKLLSDSLFAELEEGKETSGICGQEAVRQAYAGLYQELTELLQALPKYRQRAVMAKVLTFLPPFLLTREELQDYIKSSLTGCKDIAEKTACVEILEGLISEN